MTMPKRPRLHAMLVLLAPLLLQASPPAFAQDAASKISGIEQIAEDFAAVPCDDSERLAGVKALFARAGATPSDLTMDQHRDVANLVVVKQGESSGKIVIGAHYDKVANGCGAIDNWTGVVAMSHLYRTLRDMPLKKTLVFVAFGKEEKGLIGSRAMAKAIGKEQVAEYCAMVNIDSLGLGPPQVADNMSSKKLEQLAADLAKDMDMPFAHARIRGGDSDSSSFVAKKIPALTIHGMNKRWSTILHTNKDQASNVNSTSVYLGYRLALAMIVRLDGLPCDAFK